MNHVFISYRHESDVYAAKVRGLADSLKTAGLPVALDQLYLVDNPGGPDGGWAKWCVENAKKSACVLIVCSRGWFAAAQGDGPQGEGLGVATEAQILLTQIYRNKSLNARVRLVILDDFDQRDIPDELYGWQVFKPSTDQGQSEQMRRWIRQRLAMTSATGSQAAKVVYLAECTPDMDDPRGRMKAFLEERGWTVLPAGEYPEDEYQSALEKDLKESLACVQLLGPFPWKRGRFDRIQNDAAAARGLPRFRYRSSEIDLAKVDPKQREFLSAPEVIATGFEDFKAHLEKELAVLAQRRDTPPNAEGDSGTPPHVVVAIRSANPDPLWDQVFGWIYDQQKIDPAQLMPGESLEAKHRAERCHGFLVVCDAGSLEEGPYSPRETMEQCRQIQMQEKNAARRPPVALIYWPPPPAVWSRLLRTTPLKLHRILGDTPTNLGEFFDEVRKVAQ